jgi:hypothetical protein
LDKIQRIVFLNVPARQSRGYFDYFHANIQKENLVFVDALFGGLDVVARLRWSSPNGEQFVIQEVKNLIQGNRPEEAAIARVLSLFESEKFQDRENFIVVICRQQHNMNETAHQKSLSEFMKRAGIHTNLRFAGTVLSFDQSEGTPLPHYLAEDIERAPRGEVVILEFSVNTLDDPRRIVMDTLQQFPGVDATRTFFGVNYGALKEEPPKSRFKPFELIKTWASPLLALRRLILGW